MKKHEILAPAGSLAICKAVIDAGADAVYLAGNRFGARAFADNFNEEELFEAIDYAHLHDAKIYLTVNTLLKNSEIEADLYDFIKPLYLRGLDAIIVQDFGVFNFIKRYFPLIAIHCSTQMSVSNANGAAFLKELGASRVVNSRELSLSEIRNIHDKTGVEIESFVHGALCYCYSGQCLMSSIFGGRSGNRGKCAQPCRLKYDVIDGAGNEYRPKDKYPLSPKDLCTIELLPKLCEAGVYSFKIEGRMKQIDYAAGVTSIYRKYLDLYEANPAGYKVSKEDLKALEDLGNRSGFTDGYYVRHNGPSMMAMNNSAHLSGNASLTLAGPSKIAVTGYVYASAGSEIILNVSHDKCYISVTGPVIEPASKRAAVKEDVVKQISKTGDTPFEFAAIDVDLVGDCFIPVKVLNDLRRQALDELKENLLAEDQRNEADVVEYDRPDLDASEVKTGLNIAVCDLEQLKIVADFKYADQITLDISNVENGNRKKLLTALESGLERIKASGKASGIFLPYVLRDDSLAFYEGDEFLNLLHKFDTVYLRSYDEIGYIRKNAPELIGKCRTDHGLYAFSDRAVNGFKAAGINGFSISHELNKNELKHMNLNHGELIIYGRTPLMISAQCVYKNYDRCMLKTTDDKKLYLIDRYGKSFPVIRNCSDCYNVIYNNAPTFLMHRKNELEGLGCELYRIHFTDEGKSKINAVLNAFADAFIGGMEIDPPAGKDSFTNGHFQRGV